MKSSDRARHIKFCHWILDFVSNENMFNKFYFSDEAWFHLSGYINAKNFRTWSATNPHQFMESPLHPQKIGVFCAISREKIVGPFSFTTTINGDRYENLILDFISRLGWNEWKCFFQQDGARAHTKSTTIDFLGPFFGKHLIGLNSVSLCWVGPTGPTLITFGFFLWAYLENKVYKTTPQNIPDLKPGLKKKFKKVSKLKKKKLIYHLVKFWTVENILN